MSLGGRRYPVAIHSHTGRTGTESKTIVLTSAYACMWRQIHLWNWNTLIPHHPLLLTEVIISADILVQRSHALIWQAATFTILAVPDASRFLANPNLKPNVKHYYSACCIFWLHMPTQIWNKWNKKISFYMEINHNAALTYFFSKLNLLELIFYKSLKKNNEKCLLSLRAGKYHI